MSNIDLQMAEASLFAGEKLYFEDWEKDAKRWEDIGLYRMIAEIVDPKSGRYVIDVGTGTGRQLIYLAAANSGGLYIGTERTPNNVRLAYDYLQGLGFTPVSALFTQELGAQDDGKLFWKQRFLPYIMSLRPKIQQLLVEQVLIMDDDIKFPQALPAILGDEKIDAAILSMPGGSASRIYEWPFFPLTVNQRDVEERTTLISNETRAAFYHFASERVRDGGKIVVAERHTSHRKDEHVVQMETLAQLSQNMGQYEKYWRTSRMGILDADEIPANVTLKARVANKVYDKRRLESLGRRSRVSVIELIREKTPFSEPVRSMPEM